jgi:ligand-binding SRPBCC domain-containing protein
MPVIILHTYIDAPIEVVFNLSRSIDLHKLSTAYTNEEAIAGKTSGLIGLDESVTWRAKHLGFVQKLTSKITAYNAPQYFADEMVKGAFKRFKHEHIFKLEDDVVVMTDRFDYESPFGILGKIADALFLEKYMTNLLVTRNAMVKEFAENETKYKQVPGLN